MKRLIMMAMLFASPAIAEKRLADTEKKIGLTYEVVDDEKDTVRARIEVFETGLKVRGVFDYSMTSISIHAEPGQKMTFVDIEKFKALSKVLPASKSRAGDTLQAFLALLVDAFNHGIEEPNIDARATQEQLEAWTSLCYSIGLPVTANWDMYEPEQDFEWVFNLGPCGSGECMGRCGPNCGTPPEPYVQRFTQECLNDDACVGAQGGTGGNCRDEWIAAAPGYIAAPDCMNMTGAWIDPWDEWIEVEDTFGVLVGTMDADPANPGCGIYDLIGNRTGFTIGLVGVQRNPPTPNCCPRFEYIQATVHCNDSTGIFTNSCDVGGYWGFKKVYRPKEDVTPALSKPDTPHPTARQVRL